MRIGVVTNAYHPDIGGVETHTRRLCAALVAAGEQVEVLTQHAVASTESIDGVLVRRFPLTVAASNYRFSRGLWQWLRANAEDRYDLVHAHSYHALAALPAAVTNRVPLVFTPHYHGTGHSRLRAALHPVYRPVGRRIVNRAGRLICVTHAERDLLAQHFPEAATRMIVIPNGTDPARIIAGIESARTEPGRRVLCVGRLERYKRVDRILRAFAHLPGDHLLEVVGSGPARDELEQLARRLGLTGRVTFHGRLPDHEFAIRMHAASVAVSASAHEAFGMAVADALTAGLPTVASFIPAHRELAVMAGSGVPLWLVNPDDEAALADALRVAAATPRAEQGRNPLPTWSDVVLETREVYDAVAGVGIQRTGASRTIAGSGSTGVSQPEVGQSEVGQPGAGR